MAKPKKLTKEEKLAKDRIRKRNKYQEIKNDPELYRIYQEKEKERYQKKKEKKIVVSIKDMSARKQREQRRRWKKNSLQYLKKQKEKKQVERILVENTPPESENEDLEEQHPRNELHNIQQPADPLAPTPISDTTLVPREPSDVSNTIQVLNQRLRRMRYDNMKISKQLINLKKECAVLRQNKRKVLQQPKDTVEKKVDKILEEVRDEKKVKEVKKKLIFTENIAKGFFQNYSSCDKKDKRKLAQSTINKGVMKQHRVLSKLPFALQKVVSKRTNIKKYTHKKLQVQNFFEEDLNSQIAAGRKEYIKRGGVRRQKRYLADNLKNLHKKYCKQWGYISYSVFCRYRPFWVKYPSNQRDTCQCKIHANIELLIKSLKKAQIINECTASEVLESLCCDSRSEVCLGRSCSTCVKRVLNYKEFDDSECITYFEWISQKQTYMAKTGKELFKKVVVKKKKEDRPRKVIKKLETILYTFFKHQRNIVAQYTTIKDLKENLGANEVICHVDFSENFCLKYHEEIQAFHFGGSRGQVSLHTGVIYYVNKHKNRATNAFCSMSQCLNHDASAIWAHIIPVIELGFKLVPSLTAMHFVSDSPSSQYRNRFIFHMLSKLNDQFPNLRQVTWSYLEAGHGKGAPDGVGAVVKRTADNYVKYGGDISSFEEFVEVVQKNVENVNFFVIPEVEVIKQRFSANVLAFKGTTKVHQALWSSDCPYDVVLRSLSCFSCQDSSVPCHHNKHLGSLKVFDEMSLLREPASDIPGERKRLGQFRKNPLRYSGDYIETKPSKIKILSQTIIKPSFNAFDYQLVQINDETEKEPPLSNCSSKFSDDEGIQYVLCEITGNWIKNNAQQRDITLEIEPNKIKMASPQAASQFEIMDTENIEQAHINKSTLHRKEDSVMIGSWVVVEYTVKEKYKHYIGQVTDIQDNEYTVTFLRHIKDLSFTWPVEPDIDIVEGRLIKDILQEPSMNRRAQVIFEKIDGRYTID